MIIAVCMKQTFDTEALITLDDAGQVISDGVQMIINPYDEYAIEEALQIKERLGGEVVVFTVGSDLAQNALRQALAMGADRAVLLTDELFGGGDEAVTAKILSQALAGEAFDLILAGHKAIDDGSSQVASRLAQRLGLPQVNVATKIELEKEQALVHREVDGGTEIVEVQLPAMITAQKGLNEPRYPSMKGIMRAKKKPLQKLTAADLGLTAADLGAEGAKTKTFRCALPQARAGGRILSGELSEITKNLIEALRGEAKVI